MARREIEEKGNVETKSLVEYFSSLSYNTVRLDNTKAKNEKEGNACVIHC